MIDFNTLRNAYQTARQDLLAQRVPSGHWVGELSSSALSTATAVSALAIVAGETSDPSRREACRQLVARGIEWLCHRQNEDGGFGDTDKSFSNISTTMLVRAAFHLADVTDDHDTLLARADQYIDEQGDVPGLRSRYGEDRTFAVPILTNCALAGLVSWDEVSALPFEMACLPHPLMRFLRLSVVSYAIPALVAIGQARFFHRKPRNPILRVLRRLAVGRSLEVLRRMQPASGGFLEAAPLTSFVVMGLAGTGRAEHRVVRQGVKFLVDSIRDDGSWPIDTNLATWNTTLAINGLAAVNGRVGALDCLDWLLSCQHDRPHPLSHAAPGGWGWSDLSGAVPDVDDTSGALLALAVLLESSPAAKHARIREAASRGVKWLLDLQNADGGWPTFCRGWGKLPFDRSGADLTAHAIRALNAWQDPVEDKEIDAAIGRGLDYLSSQQRADGSWVPLWFGNQNRPGDENPVYGTSRVLLALRDLGKLDGESGRRGLDWLVANRCTDGGWGACASDQGGAEVSSVEETALAVNALLADYATPTTQPVIEQGLQWLTSAVAEGRHRESAPIGFYFAKLWYYERMYPLTFTVSALGRAVRHFAPDAH
ncbi:MAG: prenyltransferase/squalene oxidase repeat-containing protein [Thermoguttaceae bacterium]